MAGQVYFGNTNYQTWIKAPNTGMQAGSAGYVVEQPLLNGRSFVKRSNASRRTFSPSWIGSIGSTEKSLQTIKNFTDGLYGDGPFYWLDPFAMSQNVMAPHWAAPGLAAKDWPSLDSSIVPSFTTVAVANGHPATYATYVTEDAHSSARKFMIIIPSGYDLKFGWHSPTAATTSGTKGIKVTPYTRAGLAGTVLTPDGIATSSTVRTNTTVDGSTYGYVEISFSTTTAATVAISSMTALIVPHGSSVANGSFVAGMGTTALEFSAFPQIEYYSASVNNGQVGMSASLVEVD